MSGSQIPDDVDAEAEEQMEAAMAAIDETDTDDRPAPGDVPSATKEDVLNQRDDGDLITEEKVVETSEGWRSVELKRPSATLVMWFESQDEDIDTEDFATAYERMIVDPDLSDEEWVNGDLTMYVDLIPIVMEQLAAAMQSEFVQNASSAIDERSGEEAGN